MVLCAGGPVTQRFFSSHPIVLQVGSTVFVHGGVLPSHLEYGLERINQETREWMLGPASQRPPKFLTGESVPPGKHTCQYWSPPSIVGWLSREGWGRKQAAGAHQQCV